jgi:hypothetical protein
MLLAWKYLRAQHYFDNVPRLDLRVGRGCYPRPFLLDFAHNHYVRLKIVRAGWYGASCAERL